MPTYGVTPTGFVIKPVAAIKESIFARLRAVFGDAFEDSADSLDGQFVAAFADEVGQLWEVNGATYRSLDLLSAVDDALDNIGSITAGRRLRAQRSTVTATVTLNAGVTLPAGSVASVEGNTAARFRTLAAVTNGGGSPDDFEVEMEAETTGQLAAPGDTLTVIETPVIGWTAITNDDPADLGRSDETNPEYAARIAASTSASASPTHRGLLVALAAVDGVDAVRIFFDRRDHWVRAVVMGGDDQAVGDALWHAHALGIGLVGGTEVTVVDDNGDDQTVNFDRPIESPCAVEITATFDSTYVNGSLGTAVAAFFAALTIGEPVLISRLICALIEVQGVTDITLIRLSTPPAASNFVIAPNEIAVPGATSILPEEP
jgi:uncharacterized phage protein gp47/JayE